MAGSILGLALVATTMSVTAVVVPALSVLAVAQTVSNAADAAALAAADTASGAVAGFPCDAANQAAMLNGASVVSCNVDGHIASVTVSGAAFGLLVRSQARAGPPRPP